MLPITPIPQLTPFTCGLACLQSFAHDIGNSKITQSYMMWTFKKMLLNEVVKREDFGGIKPNGMGIILDSIGFKNKGVQHHDKSDMMGKLFPSHSEKDGLFIHLTIEGFSHWIRFAGIKDSDSIYAFWPDFSADSGFAFFEISFEKLVDSKFLCVTTKW